MDIALVLTHDCNLGCPYCYAGEKFAKRMSREVAERALDFAVQAPKERVQVSYFGGEPFLAFDLMQEFSEIARDRLTSEGRQVKFVVTTNGTCFNQERVDYLAENDFFVGLSIDGVEAAHNASRPFTTGRGSFNAVVRGLKRLQKAGLDFETISVVDPLNVQYLAETVRFLIEMGVRRISLNPNFDADWSDDELAQWSEAYAAIGDLYLQSYRRGHLVYINIIDDKVITHLKGGYKVWDECEFGKGAIAVAPSGNIYPCERLVGDDRDHTYRIGTVFEGFSQRRSCLIEMTGNCNDDCGGCALEKRCMSWCACANMADTGIINQPGGLVCFHEKAAVDIADRVAAELYKEQNPMFLQNYYLR